MGSAERFYGANTIQDSVLSPYWGEHVARYFFALPFLREDHSVLDIACGTGYGSSILQEKARHVVGVDIDEAAIRTAKAQCSKCSVVISDATKLPFRDQCFDTILSFETIEHLHKRKNFLSELRRVLKKGGHLILSTPNANYTKPIDGKPLNPYHVFEYTPEELEKELCSYFQIKKFLGQALREDFGIPPFCDAQQKLPNDLLTQARLIGWKFMNKLPVKIREKASQTLWKRAFYPTPLDYEFKPELIRTAPVLVAVCI